MMEAHCPRCGKLNGPYCECGERKSMHCIVCDVKLQAMFPETPTQPDGGTYLRTYGSYGCAAFDPIDGTFLEMYICDQCLMSKKERILHGTPPLPAPVKDDLRPWNPWDALGVNE